MIEKLGLLIMTIGLLGLACLAGTAAVEFFRRSIVEFRRGTIESAMNTAAVARQREIVRQLYQQWLAVKERREAIDRETRRDGEDTPDHKYQRLQALRIEGLALDKYGRAVSELAALVLGTDSQASSL